MGEGVLFVGQYNAPHPPLSLPSLRPVSRQAALSRMRELTPSLVMLQPPNRGGAAQPTALRGLSQRTLHAAEQLAQFQVEGGSV